MRVALGWVALTFGVVWAASIEPRAAGPAVALRAPGDPRHVETLKQYCASCHNQRLKTGGLALDRLDPSRMRADAETWEKVVRKLRLGVMPPQGAPRPDAATYDALVGWLEGELDAGASANPYPGQPVLHRLNRAEYGNAIRDLLGLDVDVTSLLPPDDAAFGFDNVADALGSSPALLQAYLAAARKISAVAVGDTRVGVGSETYSARQDLSQDHHLDGLPLGTVGGLVARHTFPLDGEYDFQVRLYRTNLSAMRGLEYPHRVELTLDGQRLLLATVGGDEDLVASQKNPPATADAIEATRLRVRRFVKAGQRELGAAFLDETPALLQTARLQPFVKDFENPYAAERVPHVQSIAVQGPFKAAASTVAQNPRVFLCRPLPRPSTRRGFPTPAQAAARAQASETECVTRIVSTLGRLAYRRPLSNAEVAGLLAAYEEERSSGTFDTGIQAVLRRILASPSFVFRPELEPVDALPGKPYHVTNFELASRLSFFLWSTIPDEELLKLAGTGRLGRPETLAAQVRRMLADPKADALTSNFAGQWLHLRNLRGIIPNTDLFPDFDDNLRQAFRRESELFFESVVTEDRNVLDLVTAGDTFVNERLARHYGIPDVAGSHFRRVTLGDDRRHGLLGKGAVLLVTSHATTTSPVLRGKWVLENLMGAPPPSPPAEVPALEEARPGEAPKTMREQMERHRANPGCATCHKTMDPIGFALENFDAVGAWRTHSETGVRLNTADVLADGTTIDGVVALREALVKRPDVFVQTLTEKLLVYALGRGLTYRDMPVVRKIVKDARAENYRFSALVLGIVNSVPFQKRMKSVDAGL